MHNTDGDHFTVDIKVEKNEIEKRNWRDLNEDHPLCRQHTVLFVEVVTFSLVVTSAGDHSTFDPRVCRADAERSRGHDLTRSRPLGSSLHACNAIHACMTGSVDKKHIPHIVQFIRGFMRIV